LRQPAIADVAERSPSPQSRCAALFDHLVGAGKKRRRDLQVERLGRLEVDRQLVLGRCLYREVSRLLAVENAINVFSRAPTLIDGVSSI